MYDSRRNAAIRGYSCRRDALLFQEVNCHLRLVPALCRVESLPMKTTIPRRVGPALFILFSIVLHCRIIAAEEAATPSAAPWISEANNAFAVALFARLAAEREGENLFFSPTSIETALAMTYSGARGNTATQMAKVLHLPSEAQTIHSDFGDFLIRLNAAKTADGKPRGYQLSVANALWGQKGYAFLPDFVSLLKKHYHAGLSEVDFETDSEGARKKINTWVEKETRDKIKDLIGQGVLTADTRLVLTNAIYFKGDWAAQFEKKATRDEPFHVSAEQQKTVPLMHCTGEYGYLEEETLQVLKLPYVGDELSMIILLPKKIDGLAALEKELTQTKLSDWFSRLGEQKVAVSMPKFKATTQFELNGVLAALGMSDAFDANRADFSGMTGNRDLCISNVIHKAFVDVNEEGTEAAAATGVVVRLTAARPSEPPPEFRADHPFLFVIRDEKSEAILFMGRLRNPGK